MWEYEFEEIHCDDGGGGYSLFGGIGWETLPIRKSFSVEQRRGGAIRGLSPSAREPADIWRQ